MARTGSATIKATYGGDSNNLLSSETLVLSTSSQQFKLALLVGGDTTDDGLNDQGVQVAQWIQATYGWTVSISQDVAYSQQNAVMASYAEQGYNVIWTDGNQFIGSTETVAAEFPNVHFIMTPTYDGDVQCGSNYVALCPNIVALSAINQATGYYLAGVLAGEMTKTDAIGVVIGQWFTALSEEFYAFEAGVNSTNPSNPPKVYLTVPGTWSDATLGYEDAMTMITSDHVDILVPIADTTGLGVIAAATATNTPLIGTVLDQFGLSPEMMTSVLMNMTAFIQPVIQHIIDGTWSQIGGKVEDLNLGSLGPFHDYSSVIPASVQTLLKTDATTIATGTIQYSGVYPYAVKADGIYVPLTYTQSPPTNNPD